MLPERYLPNAPTRTSAASRPNRPSLLKFGRNTRAMAPLACSADADAMTGGDFDGDESEESLDLGGSQAQWFGRLWAPRRRRASRLIRVLGWTVALGVGLVIGLSVQTPAKHAAQQHQPPPVPHEVARISMTAVRGLANQHGQLTSYVRQGSTAAGCALVPIGHSPARTISAAIRAAFRGYTVKDSGRTLDQNTGLCSIEVRATYRSAVLVVTVASPAAHPSRSNYTRVETGIETNAGVTTKYALAINKTGWTLLVGATGPGALLPDAEDLVRVAQEPALTW
jgi:hypothetical protein